MHYLESSRPEKRGFYGGLTMLTAVLGGVIASWFVSLLNTIFNDDEMEVWGWRIPFLSSFIVAILAFISQKHMEQSFEFLNASKDGQTLKNPIKNAVKITLEENNINNDVSYTMVCWWIYYIYIFTNLFTESM